jgi:FkbM family methyltransferase
LGFSVVAYEPDPVHVQLFKQTMQDNNSTKIDLRERAVGVNSGRSEFTRVLGNTTGSHLSGAKLEPYGDLERIIVEVESITSVLDEGFDFIKMDIEGYEAPVIESLIPDHFDNLEIMLEIGSFENARRIYRQLDRLGINAYSQKRGWARANSFLDLPISHREGSVLLTRSSFMDWRI